MAQDNDLFRTALEGKKIPILTLDHKWHKLFTQTGDNDEIHALETVVNDLLKRQGKLNFLTVLIRTRKWKKINGL